MYQYRPDFSPPSVTPELITSFHLSAHVNPAWKKFRN